MTNIGIEVECKALERDLSTLFSAFDKTGSIRYEQFSSIWRSLKFSRVHSGRKQWHEKKRGTERLFRAISRYLTETTSFQFRIAAIYALYAAYYTQLCEVKVKIRLTPAMWKEIKNLKAVVKEQRHLDAEYIINKMINEKVFLFCAMPYHLEYLHPEYSLMKDSSKDFPQMFGYDLDEYVQDVVEQLDVIKKISKVEENYLKAKDRIIKTIGEDPAAETTLKRITKIEKNIHENLLDYTEDFHHWLVTKTSYEKHRADTLSVLQKPAKEFVPVTEEKKPVKVEEEKSKVESSKEPSRSSKMEALKMRAFRMGAEVPEKRTKSQEEVDAEAEAEAAEIKRGKCERRTLYKRSAIREVFRLTGCDLKEKIISESVLDNENKVTNEN